MEINVLEIKDLSVEVEGKAILKSFSLTVKSGETHAIMGPNGSGKSTLCYALLGHPKYKVSGGEANFNGENILELSTDKRAKLGIFLGFQYPREVAGISFGNFLRQAHNLKLKELDANDKGVGVAEYYKIASKHLENLKMDKKFIGRGVNDGFSGGEKKRAEIVQMLALQPKIGILDEIDSGLDIDALKDVAEGVQKCQKEYQTGLILITHYQRLLKYLKADFVHVMVDGAIVKSGGMEIVEELEKDGYKAYL